MSQNKRTEADQFVDANQSQRRAVGGRFLVQKKTIVDPKLTFSEVVFTENRSFIIGLLHLNDQFLILKW